MSSLASPVTQRGPAMPAQGGAPAAKPAGAKRTAVKSPAHPPSAAPVIARAGTKFLAVKSSPALKPLPPAAVGQAPSAEGQEASSDDAYTDEALSLAAEMRGLEAAIAAAEDTDEEQEVALADSYYALDSAEQLEEEGSEVEEVVLEESDEETSKNAEEAEEADFEVDARDGPVSQKPVVATEAAKDTPAGFADESRETKMQLLRQRLMKAQQDAETQRRTLGLGLEDSHQEDSESRAQDATQSGKVVDDDDVPPGVLGDDSDESKPGQTLHFGESSQSSHASAADAKTPNTAADPNALGKLAASAVTVRGAMAKSSAIKPFSPKSKSVHSPRMRPASKAPGALSKAAAAATGVKLPASVDSTDAAGTIDLGEAQMAPKIACELTQDERALRGLLQFYVCEDARRPKSEEAPLRIKYKDLVSCVVSAVYATAAPSTKGKAESAGSAADAKGGSASTAEGRERLKRQLMEKQQQLAQEVKRRRQQLAQVSVGSTASSTRTLERRASSRSTSPAMQMPATRPEREAVLRRKRDEAVDAAMDAERLRARKNALEEARDRLRTELARIKQDKVRATRQVEEARAEERRVLERLRQRAKSTSFLGTTSTGNLSLSGCASTLTGNLSLSAIDTAAAIVAATTAHAPETLLQAQ